MLAFRRLFLNRWAMRRLLARDSRSLLRLDMSGGVGTGA